MRKTKRVSSSRKGKENPSSRQTGTPGFRKYPDGPRNLSADHTGTNNGELAIAKINGYERRNTEMPWDGAD